MESIEGVENMKKIKVYSNDEALGEGRRIIYFFRASDRQHMFDQRNKQYKSAGILQRQHRNLVPSRPICI